MSDEKIPDWVNGDWFEEFTRLTDASLGSEPPRALYHPLVEQWYLEQLQFPPMPPPRNLADALYYLAADVLNVAPPRISRALAQIADEQAIVEWVWGILETGRAFQVALQEGKFDDL